MPTSLCMSVEGLSCLRSLHRVGGQGGGHAALCGVSVLLLGGYIISPTVYFPLYISKRLWGLMMFFFLCACSFMNRKHVEKYEHHGNAFT